MEDTTLSAPIVTATLPTSTVAAPTQPPPANVQWSGLIKGVHQTLREAVMGADVSAADKSTSTATRKKQNNKKVGGGKRGRDEAVNSEVNAVATPSSPSTTAAVVPLFEVADTRAESYVRWQAFKDQHADQLEAYAVSMRNLAVEYWDGTRSSSNSTSIANTPASSISTNTASNGNNDGGDSGHRDQHQNQDERVFSQRTGKYDDRVGDVVGFIADYFLGDMLLQPQPATTTTTTTAAFTKLPTLVTMDLRKYRKEYFVEHGVTLPPTEEDTIVGTHILGGEGAAVPSDSSKFITSKLWSHFKDRRGDAPTVLSMDVLDVGSCYGPFQEMGDRFRSLCPTGIEVRPSVTSLDLCPYPSSSVIKCDWLEVPFFTPLSTATPTSSILRSSSLSCHPINATPLTLLTQQLSTPPFALKEFSKDAVIFCLLLSFMPTREMRFRSCVNAFRALREDGLLVIVSTKTQGSRDVMNSWVRGWKACIEAIGFRAVHQIIKSKLVYLSFRRVSLDTTTPVTPPPTTTTTTDAEVAARCWSNASVRKQYRGDFEAFYQAIYLPILEGMPKDAMGLNNDSI